ncbi:MAG: glucose-6-phosphate dehydrogenase (NADP(+)), partial [Acidobacteria bacterium]|nr:glucose-6-phosphate dehydrogenase (NADP(+)) [Acidobacteriota bacterium]
MAQAEVLTQSQRVPGRVADPCIMVIFGAAGDLTRRKLVPALYNLAKAELLAHEFAILGISHSPMSTDDFRSKLSEDIRHYAGNDIDSKIWEWFKQRMYYITAEFDDKNVYSQLKSTLEKLNQEHSTRENYFFYLATAPNFFGPIVEQLASVGLMEEKDSYWRRVIVEKPFGHDLESAKALNQHLLKFITEKQIYRIDHYLGKETVQNILAFRFANGIFEPIWNRRYIDHVQISVAETVGVEQRGSYYDQAGALRDMVPNHIMQLISLTAMEPPVSFEANAVRDEQAKVLHAIQPLSSEEVLT